MQTSKSLAKKASRKVSGTVPTPKKAVAPTVPTPKTFTPLGDAVRGIGYHGNLLVDNIEGLTYYQKAKRTVTDMFLKELTSEEYGEMTQEHKQFHIDLLNGIQEVFDYIHKEYRDGLREEAQQNYEKLLGESMKTENYA